MKRKYMITLFNEYESERPWEFMKAKTLIGAKREASKRYNYDNTCRLSTIIIGIGDDLTMPDEILCQKPISVLRWYNH